MSFWEDILIDFLPDDAYLIYGSVSRYWRYLWKKRGRREITLIKYFMNDIPYALECHCDKALIAKAAIDKGDFELLKQYFPGKNKGNELVNLAARHGRIDMIEFLIEKKIVMRSHDITEAASFGHLHVLKFYRLKVEYIWGEVCRHAAKNGHKDILTWLEKAGKLYYEAALGAAERGDLELLKWVYKYTLYLPENIQSYASIGGNLDMVIWLWQENCIPQSSSCVNAAKHRNFALLNWLHDHGCPWGTGTFAELAGTGDLPMLQRVRAQGCLMSALAYKNAARNNHLHILQWLFENDCPFDGSPCNEAALNGNLTILKWLHAHNFPLNEMTCALAASNGHLRMLKWLREVGCNWDHWVIYMARHNGFLNVLKWALSSGCEWYNGTIKHENYYIKKWLSENGYLEGRTPLKYNYYK